MLLTLSNAVNIFRTDKACSDCASGEPAQLNPFVSDEGSDSGDPLVICFAPARVCFPGLINQDRLKLQSAGKMPFNLEQMKIKGLFLFLNILSSSLGGKFLLGSSSVITLSVNIVFNEKINGTICNNYVISEMNKKCIFVHLPNRKLTHLAHCV